LCTAIFLLVTTPHPRTQVANIRELHFYEPWRIRDPAS
jgi:hypothetical protein